MTSVLPPARAFERLVEHVRRDIGERPAVSWIHAAALVQHAVGHGLLSPGVEDGPDGVRRALDAVAASHPALADLADPQVVGLWQEPVSRDGWEAITQFWAAAQSADDGHRVDGYQLGNAYQALSAEARHSRALCQTPWWVADLLLELSLTAAMDEVGPDAVRMTTARQRSTPRTPDRRPARHRRAAGDPTPLRLEIGMNQTPENTASPSASLALSERDAAILDFEHRHWVQSPPTRPGAKEADIRAELDISPARYYQLLNRLLDTEAALARHPVMINRLRAIRASNRVARQSSKLRDSMS
ncbi:DUF3263 domain-containing protein [Kitasatospora sp. NPDC004240]